MDSFYMILNSDSFRGVHPSNNVTNFKNNLLKDTYLEGTWAVALCDIQIYKPKKVEVGHSLWIYCDIVDNMQLGEVMAPLLKRITISNLKKNWLSCEVVDLYYVKLKTNLLQSINIIIKEDFSKSYNSLNWEAVASSWSPDKSTSTTVTLHFKRLL